MCDHIADILNAHRRLGPHKPVSYLPIRTIESVLGLSVGEYQAMIEQAGLRCLVIPAGEGCIASGSARLQRVRLGSGTQCTRDCID